VCKTELGQVNFNCAIVNATKDIAIQLHTFHRHAGLDQCCPWLSHHEVRDATLEMANQRIHSSVLAGVEDRFEKTISYLDSNPIDTVEPTTEQALQWLLSHEGECEGAT
jgi:hypothetical protein